MTNPTGIASRTLDFENLLLRLSMARGEAEIMAAVREQARPLIGADGISFVLRDHDSCYYADEDAIGPLWKGQRFPMDKCISGWSMLNRQTVIIEDIYNDNRIPHSAYIPTFVRSLVMVPVRHEDPVAAIGAYWAQPRRAIDYQEVETMQRIANSAAVAMTNVTLIKSLEAAKEETQRAKDAIVMAMASLAATRDKETGNHLYRTQHYLRALAKACRRRGRYATELDDAAIDLLFRAAPLHDVGKVGIPDGILLKPGRLEPAEFEIMKGHASIGAEAIGNAMQHIGSASPFLRLSQEIALSHHEKWDGTGYPHGLKQTEIPLSARLMAIADVHDALVSERAYKPALPHREAVEIIAGERAKQFDPTLVDVFVDIAHAFDAIHRQFSDEPEPIWTAA